MCLLDVPHSTASISCGQESVTLASFFTFNKMVLLIYLLISTRQRFCIIFRFKILKRFMTLSDFAPNC